MLEPYVVKVTSTVLRGESGGNTADLPARFGKIDYPERVCKVNLSKLSFIMKEVRAYARKNYLKPSFMYYKQWGRKGKKQTSIIRHRTSCPHINRTNRLNHNNGIKLCFV